MIRPDVLDRFAETFEPVGFDRKAFIPSYGMAEVCLAITFSPHGTGVRTDIDRPRRAGRRPARGAGRRSPGRAARAPLRAVRQGAARPSPGSARRRRQGAGRPRGRAHLRRRAQHHAGLFRRARGHARGAVGRRLARHRRPRLQAGGRDRRHRPRQGPDHRQRPQCLAAGHRMGDRGPERREERRFGGLLRRYRRGRARRRGGAGARVGRGGAARRWRATWRARCARRSPSTATSSWCRRPWACRRRRRASCRARAPRPTISPASTRPRPPRPEAGSWAGWSRSPAPPASSARISLPPWPVVAGSSACWSAAGRRCPRWPASRPTSCWAISSDEAALRRLVDGADAVIHAAGLIKARRPSDFMTVNRDGTALLSALAPEAPFLLLSSLAAREPQLSPYAASKRAAEEVVAGRTGPWLDGSGAGRLWSGRPRDPGLLPRRRPRSCAAAQAARCPAVADPCRRPRRGAGARRRAAAVAVDLRNR